MFSFILFNRTLLPTQRWITTLPTGLRGPVLLRASTNISIKALLIDAELGDPSAPIHYSGYNFLQSAWQLTPSTLVSSGNYRERKGPLN